MRPAGGEDRGERAEPVRVWPVVLAPIGAVCAASVGAAAAVLVAHMVGEMRATADGRAFDPEALLREPMVLAVSIAAGQVGMLAFVALLGVVAGRAWRDRLGLVRPALAWWAWGPMVAGNFFVWLVSVWLFGVVMPEPGEHLEQLTETVTRQGVWGRVLLVVGAALLPGVGEELLSRGFVLRRLLRGWGRSGRGAVLAVVVTSVLFAAMHLDLRHMVLIGLLGAYWSVVAWRTGSALPTMLLHGLNNAWALALVWTYGEAGPPVWFAWVILGVGGPGFVVTMAVLFCRPVPTHAAA